MNAPIKQMAQFFNVNWDVKIDGILRDEHTWHLRSGRYVVRAQRLICAIPAEQAAELLAKEAPEFAAKAAAVESKPCWALMVRLPERLGLNDTHRGESVAWAARNSAKPGRGEGEDWVIHASPEWSAEHLELDKDAIAEKLLGAFLAETGIAPVKPIHAAAHRWRYAMVGKAEGASAYWDDKLQLGICGDWLAGPRVENAFLSGHELAQLVPE